MPIKSKSQLKRFEHLVKEGKMRPEVLTKLIDETSDFHKLPEKVSGADDQISTKLSGTVKSSKVIK